MIVAKPYTDALAHIHAPDWLTLTRQASLADFLDSGLPGKREEAWKYTSLAHLEQADLHAPDIRGREAVCPDVTAYPGHTLAFQDGELACHGTYLPNQLASTLLHLSDTLIVKTLLGSIAPRNTLAKLNQALWRDGARIYVPTGSQVNLPIFTVFAASEPGAMLYPRTLVLMERGSEAILVEHYTGQTDQPYWQNAVSEVFLEAGSQLTHIRLIEEGPGATHTGLTAVRIGRDSEYRMLNIVLSGGLARHELVASLEGEGASIRADALNLVDGTRHGDLHLRIDHAAPKTRSRVVYRGLAAGRGRDVFDGRIVVQHQAHQTDARQSCRSLLLSPDAEVDAKPQLEIYADDVKCSHGATVGQLDAEALFYLESRGIDPAVARQMLLEGFAIEALGLIEEVRLQRWLMPRIRAALPRHIGKEARP